MRKVQIYKFGTVRKGSRDWREKVEDGFGRFHGWGSDYEEFESGAGNFSTAIIERSDGTIETPSANMIKFIEEFPELGGGKSLNETVGVEQ